MNDWHALPPDEIERQSFEIITREMGETDFDEQQLLVVKRVIHTTADFSFADSIYFSENALQKAIDALCEGADILTDTNMARAGINKAALSSLGGEALCFMADEEIAAKAKALGVTRAAMSMEKACGHKKPLIIASGNAPTALLRLCELIDEGKISPRFIVAAPVGFVNVTESKQEVEKRNIPCIVARGRRGGSNVAAAICNAILYMAAKR